MFIVSENLDFVHEVAFHWKNNIRKMDFYAAHDSVVKFKKWLASYNIFIDLEYKDSEAQVDGLLYSTDEESITFFMLVRPWEHKDA